MPFLTHVAPVEGIIFFCEPTPQSQLSWVSSCNLLSYEENQSTVTTHRAKMGRQRRATKREKGPLAGFRALVPVLSSATCLLGLVVLTLLEFCKPVSSSFSLCCLEKCFYYLEPSKYNIKSSLWSPPGKVLFPALT